MKIVAIIQARMSSTRLPGKVLESVSGRPLLWYTVERVRLCSEVEDVVVATSDREADDPIESFCGENGVECFRGDHDDVLKRFVEASKKYDADIIVRITGDCPLVDPGVIGEVIKRFKSDECDYSSNVFERTYPHGLDVEVFSREALERSDSETKDAAEREHVTRYIRNNPELFRTASITNDEDLSDFRWTVDEPEDLELIRKIYEHFGRHDFSWEELIEAFRENPEWEEINRGVREKHVYT